jgi:large subunit ribosomal protein L4
MKVAVYNQSGKETGEVTLPKEIFEVPMNADLVHQVVISQTGNKRQVSAHTKNRSEVRGGGRKPWRQKGTGRARHGSTRSQSGLEEEFQGDQETIKIIQNSSY